MQKVVTVPSLSLILVYLLWYRVHGQSEGDLRLNNYGSTGGSSGRLEIYHNFRWGTVCDDSFGSPDATVACRQLGYSGASDYGSVGRLGFSRASLSTPIWLDDLRCTGSESRLALCRHRGYGVENCGHSEDIALICSSDISRTSSSAIGAVIGPIIGIVGLLIGICIICTVCCIRCHSSSRRHSTVRTVHPPRTSNVVTYTTTQVATAYPTQRSYSTGPQQPPSAYLTHVPQDPYSNKEPGNSEFSTGAPPDYDFFAHPPPVNPYLPTDPNAGSPPPPVDPNKLSGYPPNPSCPDWEQYPQQY